MGVINDEKALCKEPVPLTQWPDCSRVTYGRTVPEGRHHGGRRAAQRPLAMPRLSETNVWNGEISSVPHRNQVLARSVNRQWAGAIQLAWNTTICRR
jgi:hypothetical protein